MKKIFFEGDHKDYHAGSAAVSDFIRNVLTGSGYQFVPTIVESDICLVNGEGSMHHQSVDFHRKMRTMHRGKQLQKKVFLVNSVWQDNGLKYHDLLKSLDGIAVRGVASQRQLHIDHGIKAARHLDFSYFLDIDESVDFVDFDGAVVMTDCWISPDIRWAWLNVSAVQSFKKIDLKDFSWSSLIKSLRTASLLVTGRHHGMYAACKAEIPFVCMRGNCHKMEDLLHSSRVQIPIARNTVEVLALIRWALKNPVPFEKLFDWMRDQTRWTGIHQGDGELEGNAFSCYLPSLQARGSMAERRRAFSEASSLWQEVGDEADNSQQRRLALSNVLRCTRKNRDIPSGICLLTKLLNEDLQPEEINKAVMQFRILVRDLRAWDTKPTNYCFEVTPEFERLAECLYEAAHSQELDKRLEFASFVREAVLALDSLSNDKPLSRLLILSAFAGLQLGRQNSANSEFFKDLRNEYFHADVEKVRGYREFCTLIWPDANDDA